MRPPTSPPLLLGIEAGATKTVAISVRADGSEHLRQEFGPANLYLLTDRDLTSRLRTIARATGRPDAVAVGMAGARTPADHARVRLAASRVWPGVPMVACSDLATSLAAARGPARRKAARTGVKGRASRRPRVDRQWDGVLLLRRGAWRADRPAWRLGSRIGRPRQRLRPRSPGPARRRVRRRPRREVAAPWPPLPEGAAAQRTRGPGHLGVHGHQGRRRGARTRGIGSLGTAGSARHGCRQSGRGATRRRRRGVRGEGREDGPTGPVRARRKRPVEVDAVRWPARAGIARTLARGAGRSARTRQRVGRRRTGAGPAAATRRASGGGECGAALLRQFRCRRSSRWRRPPPRAGTRGRCTSTA